MTDRMPSTAMTPSVPETHVLRAVLGLPASWRIERVDRNEADRCMHLWLAPAETRWTCPSCDRHCPPHDSWTECVWRHLDICEYRTLLHASMPRVTCPTHGVTDVAVPWAGHGRSFTFAMEQRIVALAESSSVSAASLILQIGWEQVWALMIWRRVGI